ncbi:hypothetical protein BJX99DRAFT_175093 [Aspergillus californicus]
MFYPCLIPFIAPRHTTNSHLHTEPGQWLVHPTPKDQAELDAIEDMEETIFNPWAAVTDLPIFETEHFHRVLISLGHAARRMPLLICMIYDLDHEPRFLFVFHTRSEVGHGDEWGLESPYHIDERVAGAWGCPSLLELEAETEADEEKVLSKVVEWPLK